MREIPLDGPRRTQTVVWVAVCEGDSEATYMDGLRRFTPGVTFRTRNARGGDIGNIWKEARMVLNDGPGAVIMDTDRSGADALRELRSWCDRRGVMLLVSNPSFEVWLLMHFQDVSPSMDQRDLEHALTEHLGRRYEKRRGIRPDRAMISDAAERSRARIGSAGDPFEHVLSNPGTSTMHLLLDAARSSR